MTHRSASTVDDGDGRRQLRPGDDLVPWSADIVDRSIPDRFAEIVRRSPDRPAVEAGGTVLSYAELSARSASIAEAIAGALPIRVIGEPRRDDGLPPVRSVAILLDQGLDLPVAAMATLRAGAVFVPIDPSYPAASLVDRLDHADAIAVLASPATIDLARAISGSRPVIDVTAVPLTSGWRDPSIDPDAPATLFYTSGSTGRPKGVLDSHRNVLHNVGRYSTSLGIGAGDRLTLLHAPTFSGIVSTLFAGLLNGATVLPFDLRHLGLDRAARWLVESRATMLHAVPIVSRSLFDGSARYPDLRVVRLEGDLATWSDARRFAAHTAQDAVLVNGLGATETGLTRQFFVDHRMASGRDGAAGSGALPIGYPVPDMTVSVVGPEGEPLGVGPTGELVVTSRFLALGYHRDPDRTAAAFATDATDPASRRYRTGDLGRLDADGCLRHLGRLDGSHKIRGQTVDPSETARALEAQPEVRAAVAVTRQDERDGPARLVAYVVREPGDGTDLGRLRRAVAAVLPDIQVPAAIVELPALPITSSGKVDRAALPAPGHARPPLASDYRAATDPLEEELVSIWGAVIGVTPVGVDDDFFELGGDSFGALRMLLEVGQAYGRDLSAETLVRRPTIAGLADELRASADRVHPSDDPSVLHLAEGVGVPIFAIHTSDGSPWLFRSVVRVAGWSRPFVSLGPDETTPARQREDSIPAMADAHLARIRAIQPAGPYHLTGFCYGALIAFEVAHRLRAEGETVAGLTLLSITPLEFPTLISPEARARYRRSALRERARRVARLWRERAATDALGGMSVRLRQHALGLAYRRQVGGRGNPGDLALEGAPDVAAARAAAVDDYDARPFPGRVTVVVGREATPRFLRDPHADFAGLSTHLVRVAVLAGDEHAMLAEPEAAALARILASGPSDGGRYDSDHGE